MEKSFDRAQYLRFVAANTMKKEGYEVYALPLTSVKHVPHLIAYRNDVFYHIYLFESHNEKAALFKGTTEEKIFEYAKIMNAKILTGIIHVVSPGEGLSLILTSSDEC